MAHTTRLISLLALGLLWGSQAPAQNVDVAEDGDFTSSNWVSTKLSSSTGTGSFTAVTESAGGNPGSYRRVTYIVQGGSFMVSHMDSSLSYSPAQQGPIRLITYSYDVKVIQGTTGQTYQLAVFQNGNTYVGFAVQKTDGLTTWTTITSPGSLGSGEFSKIDGPGPANPDFSAAGGTIYFGYFTSNTIPQTCSYYGCMTSTAKVTLDTGIDNVTVNITPANVSAGASCSMNPVNRFIPFHVPALHVNHPDTYPNHRIKVLVMSDGAPAAGVNVSVNASRTALSTSAQDPPTLDMQTATTESDGNAVFFHNTPVQGAYTRTDFKASGVIGGNSFSCQSAVVTGIGALTDGLQNFFGSPAAQQPSLFALRAILLEDRKLINELDREPRYRSVVRKILGMEQSHWSIRDAHGLVELLGRLQRESRPNSKEILAELRQDFQGALESRRSTPRHRKAAVIAKSPGDALHPNAARLAARKDYGHLPLSFEPNRGQFDRHIRYLAHAAGFNVALTEEGLLVNAGAPKRSTPGATTVQMEFPGGNSAKRMIALDQQPGVSNYLIGNDASKWRTGIAQFGQVKYEAIYPGIDLVLHGRGRQVEFDFVVAPGAHPDKIRFGFRGNVRLESGPDGLILHNAGGMVRLEKPVVYQQEKDGNHKKVDGEFAVLNGNQVSFQLGAYDATKTLVIDPVLSYSSLLGGADYDAGAAIALDSQGYAYVTGATCSLDFPTLNAPQTKLSGAEGSSENADAFVFKMDPTGSKLVYSTYIGGNGTFDAGLAIAVDSQGAAYVAGSTNSRDFPLVHPIQQTFGGGASPSDAFALKLAPTGSALIYSTYLGGSGDDTARAIAVDSSGNAYIAGQTSSLDFPLKNPIQGQNHGLGDAFVAKINAAGTGLVYSTLLGGTQPDIALAIAVDAAGNTYLAGNTNSPDFPTSNPVQKYGGATDAFVTKLSPDGSMLLYSTFLGGSSDDLGMGIAIDGGGNAYVTGVTGSPDFPVLNAVQSKFGSTDGYGADAFVTKLDPTGSHLVYSTFLGGQGVDTGLAIAVGGDGSAFVAGETQSADFPLAAAIQALSGGTDAFLAKLNPAGSQLVYSTPIGGSGNDSVASIALDSSGNVLLAGTTGSVDFPITYGAYQSSLKGGTDVLVMKLAEGTPVPALSTVSAASYLAGPGAPEAIEAGFGAGLASASQPASSVPLPTELLTTSVHVKDSAGNERPAPLFFISSKQIDYLIPAGTATGLAEVTVVSAGQAVASQTLQIDAVAPALFSANGDGRGVAAGSSIQVAAGGKQKVQPVFQCGTTAGSCTPVAVDLGDGSAQLFLQLFGTGIRGRSGLSVVSASLGNVTIPVVFAGPQGAAEGLDQINLGPLPQNLKGAGTVNLVLTVDGKQANSVTVSFK